MSLDTIFFILLVSIVVTVIYTHMDNTTYQRFRRIYSDIKRDRRGSQLQVVFVAFKMATGHYRR